MYRRNSHGNYKTFIVRIHTKRTAKKKSHFFPFDSILMCNVKQCRKWFSIGFCSNSLLPKHKTFDCAEVHTIPMYHPCYVVRVWADNTRETNWDICDGRCDGNPLCSVCFVFTAGCNGIRERLAETHALCRFRIACLMVGLCAWILRRSVYLNLFVFIWCDDYATVLEKSLAVVFNWNGIFFRRAYWRLVRSGPSGRQKNTTLKGCRINPSICHRHWITTMVNQTDREIPGESRNRSLNCIPWCLPRIISKFSFIPVDRFNDLCWNSRIRRVRNQRCYLAFCSFFVFILIFIIPIT